MFLFSAILVACSLAADPTPLAGTSPLEAEGDIAMQMVAGIDTYLNRALDESVAKRAARWQVDTTSQDAYINTIDPVRERFASILGVVDKRDSPNMEIIAAPGAPNLVKTAAGTAYRIRWRVFRGIEGEGVLIEPSGVVYAQAVVIPDCDTSPEEFSGLANVPSLNPSVVWRLAARGCRVIVPMLVDRADTYSGTPGVRMTNQPHREFIYRTGYELGRHIIGYEVQRFWQPWIGWKRRVRNFPLG